MQYDTTVLTFKNQRGECFHIQLAIPPLYEGSVTRAREAAVPVLFCVHGAGMSGDNFLRLAQHMSHFPQRPVDADGGASAAAAADLSAHIGNYSSPGQHMIDRRTSQLSATSSLADMPPPPPLPLCRPPPPPSSQTSTSPSLGTTGTSSSSHASPGTTSLPSHHVSNAAVAAAAAAGGHHSTGGRPPIPRGIRPTLAPSPLQQTNVGGGHPHSDAVGVGAVGATPPLMVVGGEVLRSPMASSSSAGPSSLGGGVGSCGSAGGFAGGPADGVPRSSGSFSEAGEVEACTVMFDLRCHGKSDFAGGEASLTLAVLVEDFLDVLTYVVETVFPTSLVFVLGHSLGAAIVAAGLGSAGSGNASSATTTSTNGNGASGSSSSPPPSLLPPTARRAVPKQVAGVVLLDAVEGTAKLSVQHMKSFLSTRPVEFAEIREAEQWFLQHGGMRTVDGAHTSVPPLLRTHPSGTGYVWRSNLEAMESVWDGWFDGLDANFLSIPLPKMLCVASVDRLDRALTVGHMQGKFQLEVCGHQSGHYIQDDMPGALAAKLRRFIKRTQDVQRVLRGGVFVGPGLTPPSSTHP